MTDKGGLRLCFRNYVQIRTQISVILRVAVTLKEMYQCDLRYVLLGFEQRSLLRL